MLRTKPKHYRRKATAFLLLSPARAMQSQPSRAVPGQTTPFFLFITRPRQPCQFDPYRAKPHPFFCLFLQMIPFQSIPNRTAPPHTSAVSVSASRITPSQTTSFVYCRRRPQLPAPLRTTPHLSFVYSSPPVPIPALSILAAPHLSFVYCDPYQSASLPAAANRPPHLSFVHSSPPDANRTPPHHTAPFFCLLPTAPALPSPGHPRAPCLPNQSAPNHTPLFLLAYFPAPCLPPLPPPAPSLALPHLSFSIAPKRRFKHFLAGFPGLPYPGYPPAKTARPGRS